MSEPITAPLEGVRVLDLGVYLAGPLAGMLLTDQGAETIKIEPVAGPLFVHPVNAVLNRGKSVLPLDLKWAAGRAALIRLIERADILIENFGPGVMERLGLSHARLRELNAGLIVLTLPGFAPGDRLGGAPKAYEGIVAASTGQYTDIHAARQIFGLNPVYTPLPLASVYAAVHAATAAVLALRRQRSGRRGTVIMAPLANAAVSAMTSMFLKIENQPERYDAPRLPKAVRDYVAPLMRAYAKGRPAAQAKLLALARKSYPALMTSYRCADGELIYLFALDNRRITRAALNALGLNDELLAEGLVCEDPFTAGDRRDNLLETSNLSSRAQADLKSRIAAKIATLSGTEIVALMNDAGVPCTFHRTTQEWLTSQPLREAGLAVTVEDEDLGPTVQPGLQTWFANGPAAPRASSPSADLPAWGERDTSKAATSADESSGPGGWLSGSTVLDMTSMVAGPVSGRTLAEYGARVIKIESPSPNHGPRMTCWYGVDVNQGKESILLDLKTPEGRGVFRSFLEKADVVLSNHVPEALARLGLSVEEVLNIKPDIVFALVGAFEGPSSGPWAGRHGYDPVLQAASGIMLRYGDPGHPELHAIASCVDALTGYSSAFGIALALLRKDSGCGGGTVRTSLAAAATLIQLPFAIAYDGRQSAEPSGQLARGENGLYRLYNARDGWLFLAAPEASIREVADTLRLTVADPSEADLEKSIARRKRAEVVERLLAAGLSAAAVRTIQDLRPLLLEPASTASTSLLRREVKSLGPVIQSRPTQIFADGQPLREVAPARKPGADTEQLVTDLGFDAATLFDAKAIKREVSRDYLPH